MSTSPAVYSSSSSSLSSSSSSSSGSSSKNVDIGEIVKSDNSTYYESIYTPQNLTWQKVAIFGIALGSGLLLIALLGIIPAIGFTVTAILALSGIGIGLGFASSILLWQCKKNTRVENVINDTTLLDTLRKIRLIYRELELNNANEILGLFSKISGQQQVILTGNTGNREEDAQELTHLSKDLKEVVKLIVPDDSKPAGEELDTQMSELNEEIAKIKIFLEEYATNVSKIAETIRNIERAKLAAANPAENAT